MADIGPLTQKKSAMRAQKIVVTNETKKHNGIKKDYAAEVQRLGKELQVKPGAPQYLHTTLDGQPYTVRFTRDADGLYTATWLPAVQGGG